MRRKSERYADLKYFFDVVPVINEHGQLQKFFGGIKRLNHLVLI
jgi:hypothetical protein